MHCRNKVWTVAWNLRFGESESLRLPCFVRPREAIRASDTTVFYMGCLFSSEEVQTRKYAVGEAATGGDSMNREAADAVALVTGSNAYSSWVEVQVSCKELRTADTFS